MGASHSRGFHRLGLFLAVLPFLTALAFSTYIVSAAWEADAMNGVSWHDYWTGTAPYQSLWLAAVVMSFALPVSLAVYGIVRAIGWVVAGFTSR